jgi:hypothetical protein
MRIEENKTIQYIQKYKQVPVAREKFVAFCNKVVQSFNTNNNKIITILVPSFESVIFLFVVLHEYLYVTSISQNNTFLYDYRFEVSRLSLLQTTNQIYR